MRELVRTNNLVLISAIEALLDGADIAHMIVDQNMSVLEGSIGIFPRRILVEEDQLTAARRLLKEAGLADELVPMPVRETETSEDAILAGRLVLRQPLRGHRVGHDALLLAAAVAMTARRTCRRSRLGRRRGRTGAGPACRRRVGQPR